MINKIVISKVDPWVITVEDGDNPNQPILVLSSEQARDLGSTLIDAADTDDDDWCMTVELTPSTKKKGKK
jgi:hypothetical protein